MKAKIFILFFFFVGTCLGQTIGPERLVTLKSTPNDPFEMNACYNNIHCRMIVTWSTLAQQYRALHYSEIDLSYHSYINHFSDWSRASSLDLIYNSDKTNARNDYAIVYDTSTMNSPNDSDFSNIIGAHLKRNNKWSLIKNKIILCSLYGANTNAVICQYNQSYIIAWSRNYSDDDGIYMVRTDFNYNVLIGPVKVARFRNGNVGNSLSILYTPKNDMIHVIYYENSSSSAPSGNNTYHLYLVSFNYHGLNSTITRITNNAINVDNEEYVDAVVNPRNSSVIICYVENTDNGEYEIYSTMVNKKGRKKALNKLLTISTNNGEESPTVDIERIDEKGKKYALVVAHHDGVTLYMLNRKGKKVNSEGVNLAASQNVMLEQEIIRIVNNYLIYVFARGSDRDR